MWLYCLRGTSDEKDDRTLWILEMSNRPNGSISAAPAGNKLQINTDDRQTDRQTDIRLYSTASIPFFLGYICAYKERPTIVNKIRGHAQIRHSLTFTRHSNGWIIVPNWTAQNIYAKMDKRPTSLRTTYIGVVVHIVLCLGKCFVSWRIMFVWDDLKARGTLAFVHGCRVGEIEMELRPR